ncbi:MAG: tRNA pseudouridine(55) synthase TruB [Acidobacteria bacterium]|nr:tRNA pseudouridine(55) synthase TruB [Acidobacteriota bacterium]MCA1651113.1 tRNA pseudouridine(55) synthase TruB [Acidobacteriota bacterium]
MNGVLVVDKPVGPTSHDVVVRVRRALGVSRVGHTGTLDPLASGVLPLVIGRATRLASLMSAATKQYEAAVRFGATTDSYDVQGRLVSGELATDLNVPSPPAGLTANAIEAWLNEFRGTYLQTPPPFSAKKFGGVPAYRLARQKRPVTPPPVSVSVERLTLQGYDAGLAHLIVTCSAGFYVRSLAHELGQRLGCGAYLEALRRTRAGDVGLDQAIPLDTLETEGPASVARLIPMDVLLPWLARAVLNERGVDRASHGNALGVDDLTTRDGSWDGPVRLTDATGALLGIAETRADGLLHPVIVLV